jgi:membrane protein YdbS with pleckstrin-like domain
MKKLDLILLIIIGYGVIPFASIISTIWPLYGNILLFSCLGIVLLNVLRAIIQRNGWKEIR